MSHTIYIAGGRNQIVEGDPFVSVEEMRSRLPSDDPWVRLAVWKLDNGDWYAVRFRGRRASIEPDEVGEAKRITANFEDPIYGGPKDEEERIAWQVEDVMKFFEWSWLAKSLANEAGWNFEVNIDK